VVLAALGQREREVGGGRPPAAACATARRRAGWMTVAAVAIGLAIAAVVVMAR